MAELFGVEVLTINYDCKEIFGSKELREEGTIRKFRIVQQEGSRELPGEQLPGDSVPNLGDDYSWRLHHHGFGAGC